MEKKWSEIRTKFTMATYAYSDEEGVIIHDYPIALL
jgi:hypothetical protein